MADLVGITAVDDSTFVVTADFYQGAADTIGIACVLYGRGVSQEFALPADCSLDQVAEKGATITDDHETDPQGENRGDIVFSGPSRTAIAGAAQDVIADQADHHDAVQQTHQADVQAHIAVEDMAELMGDYTLQFIAAEFANAAAGDADHGVAGFVTGGEGIDGFILHQVNRWNRRARSDSHLFHDVEDLAFIRVARAGIEQAAAQRLGHHLAAAAQLGQPDQHADAHHDNDNEADLDEDGRREEFGIEPYIRLRIGKEQHGNDKKRGDDDQRHHRTQEQDHQFAGVAPSLVLVSKEIH